MLFRSSQEWKNVLYLHSERRDIMQTAHSLKDICRMSKYIFPLLACLIRHFRKKTKRCHIDDGVFEVTLIKKPRNPIELNEIIASLINLVDDTDMIYSFKSDEVEFMAREEVPWTLDGEFGGAHEEVIVKNICRAVDIMVSTISIS